MKKRAARTSETPSRLIRKANELVEARYRYDIWQIRVFTKILTLIDSSDTDFHEYKIYLTEFIKEFDLKKGGNIYQLIKTGAEGLMQKKVVIDEMMDGKLSELQTWMLSSVQTFKDNEKANYLKVTIHPKLKPYLLELRQKYLVYDIRNVLKLTSVYSIRIYELLKQYEKIGKRSFDIENLKLILGILPDEYKLYGHFKDKVILKAQADLLAETDISFTFEEKKEGKRVVGLTFFIHPNAARRGEMGIRELPTGKMTLNAKSAVLESPFFKEVVEQARGWGITETKLREIFVDNDENKVRTGLECTLDNLKQGKIKENIGGFFIRAVEEGWTSGKQVRKNQAAENRQKATELKAKTTETLSKWEVSLESLLDSRRTAANDVVRSLTPKHPDLADRAVQAILSENLTRGLLETATGLNLNTLILDDWRNHRPLRDAIIRQIEKMHPEDFKEVQVLHDEAIKRARRAVNELKSQVG